MQMFLIVYAVSAVLTAAFFGFLNHRMPPQERSLPMVVLCGVVWPVALLTFTLIALMAIVRAVRQ